MRYIDTAAKPLKVGNQELGVRETIAHALNTDRRFNADGVGIRCAMRIDSALTASLGRPFVAIEEADWQRLREAIEEPSGGYAVHPARALVQFIEAIAGAPEQKPAEEAKAAE